MNELDPHPPRPAGADAHEGDGRDSLRRARSSDAGGNPRDALRFRAEDRGEPAHPHPRADRLLRPHADQKRLQNSARAAARSSSASIEMTAFGDCGRAAQVSTCQPSSYKSAALLLITLSEKTSDKLKKIVAHLARCTFSPRMTRAILLATSVHLALFTLSPSAFSASVVHNGSLANLAEAGSAPSASQRDLDRLTVAARGSFFRQRVSLTSTRTAQTLTGAAAEVAGSSVVALPDRLSEIDAKTCAAVPGPVPAPAPANTVGSASAFEAVPEPSSLILLALGAASLLRRQRR